MEVQWNTVNMVTNGPKTFGFLQESVWPFCRGAKKSGHNNKVTILPRWL